MREALGTLYVHGGAMTRRSRDPFTALPSGVLPSYSRGVACDPFPRASSLGALFATSFEMVR